MERTSGNLSIKAVVLLRFVRADSDVFEVAFGIARVYDDQLKDSATAVRYYGEALAVLEAISTEATDWSAYMRVTTLGAFALCYENLYVRLAACGIPELLCLTVICC